MSWNDVFLKDLDWNFAFEIVVRTVVMFVLILVILRMTGKKGVRQLSIFEVAIIIGFGSAAGDPMFTKEVAIVPSLIVMLVILGIYRTVTWIASKSERFESVLEGQPVYIIEDGMFVLQDRNDLNFAKDEFLAELRQQSVEHLGQIRIAILETTGNVSLFFYSDDDVRPGMPILPKVYFTKSIEINEKGKYACTYCGHVEQVNTSHHKCNRCGRTEWVKVIDTVRLS